MAHERGLEQLLLDRAGALAAHLNSSEPALDDQALVRAIELVGDARRAVDALGAHLAGQLSARSPGFTEQSIARRLGEKSAASAIATLAGLDPTEAHDWCVAGEAVALQVSLLGEILPDRYPHATSAFAAGSLTPRGVRAIVKALGAVKNRVSDEQLLDVEDTLVQHAQRLSARDIDRLCRQVVDRYDPDGAEPREDELRARSGVQVIRGRDGLITWILKMHPEAAGFVTTAVDARTAPRRQPTFTGADDDLAIDDRSLAQRRLDALVSIARESLGNDHGQVAGISVTMNVTMTLDQLLGGLGAARIAGIDESISAATARRLAADARIIPIVLGGDSEPLDLGLGRRLFSEAQRRALARRDGGCVFTNCLAPAGWCEVAHLTAWAAGGPTDLANGALMCPFHHRRFDHDGWDYEWVDAELQLIPPAATAHTRAPRFAGTRARAA